MTSAERELKILVGAQRIYKTGLIETHRLSPERLKIKHKIVVNKHDTFLQTDKLSDEHKDKLVKKLNNN